MLENVIFSCEGDLGSWKWVAVTSDGVWDTRSLQQKRFFCFKELHDRLPSLAIEVAQVTELRF